MSAAAKVLWAARDLPIPKSRTEQGRSALTLCVSAPNLHLVQLSLWLSEMRKGFRLALAACLCSVRKTTPEQGHIVTLRNHPGCWHWENIPMSRTGFCPGDIRVLKRHSHPSQCSAHRAAAPAGPLHCWPLPSPHGKPHTPPRQHTNTKLLPAALSILLFKGWRQWQAHRQCYLQSLAGSVGGGT